MIELANAGKLLLDYFNLLSDLPEQTGTGGCCRRGDVRGQVINTFIGAVTDAVRKGEHRAGRRRWIVDVLVGLTRERQDDVGSHHAGIDVLQAVPVLF